MKFSFIHIADIHLGRAFSNLSAYSFDESVKQIYKNAVESAFNNFINFAVEKNVDFILMAGDTFDNTAQDFKSKLILKEGLKKLDTAGIKVYIICGNHDPICAYNKMTFNFDDHSNIKIIGLNTPQYGSFIIKDLNSVPVAMVHAYSYKENYTNENPLKYFETIRPDEKQLFNIGLLHCDLDADKSSPYIPASTGELQALNYDYWALGHIHVPSPAHNIAYSGTIQGRNSKETGAHGFKYIIVENNSIIQNSFVPADIIRFENIDINLSDTNDTTNAYEKIHQTITDFTQTELCQTCRLSLLKLNLNGNISFYSEVTQDFYKTISERIKQDFNNSVYISDIINNTRPKINDEILNEDDGISGELYRTINTVNINNAVNEALEEYKNIIHCCNFSDTEFAELKKEISQTVSGKCLNLANHVYHNEERQDSDD